MSNLGRVVCEPLDKGLIKRQCDKNSPIQRPQNGRPLRDITRYLMAWFKGYFLSSKSIITIATHLLVGGGALAESNLYAPRSW